MRKRSKDVKRKTLVGMVAAGLLLGLAVVVSQRALRGQPAATPPQPVADQGPRTSLLPPEPAGAPPAPTGPLLRLSLRPSEGNDPPGETTGTEAPASVSTPPPPLAAPDNAPPSGKGDVGTYAPLQPVPESYVYIPPAPTRARVHVLPLAGTYTCTLDDNCLTLPGQVRDLLGHAKVLYVLPGAGQCLWLYTPAWLERACGRIDQLRSRYSDAQVYAMRRQYLAQFEVVRVDSSGHVLVPGRLAQSAGLSKEAVLIGVADHLELWDPQRWQHQLSLSTVAPAREATSHVPAQRPE